MEKDGRQIYYMLQCALVLANGVHHRDRHDSDARTAVAMTAPVLPSKRRGGRVGSYYECCMAHCLYDALHMRQTWLLQLNCHATPGPHRKTVLHHTRDASP